MNIINRFLVTTLSAALFGFSGLMASAAVQASPAGSEHRTPPKVRVPGHRDNVVIHRGPVYPVRRDRIRHHRNVVIVRPYGHWYHGYGHFYHDDDAYKWLAFTAIALKVLDNLNEEQQREHEAAQVKATTADVGETIVWNKGGASGSVTTLRDGTSTSGRYCREFQQKITIGGKEEMAYGTACRNPDGSWEVVSTESR